MSLGSRRLSVWHQIAERIEHLNEIQDAVRALPIESYGSSDEAARLEHLDGLLRHLRVEYASEGRVPEHLVIALGAQVVAFAVALEERDMHRVDVGEAA
jgi:hypothetical protein